MTKQLEEPAYEIVVTFEEFEIRTYAPYIHAQVADEHSNETVNRRSFQRIASYIFGGNVQQQQIAMTSPVLMWNENGTSMMSFVMPSTYDLNSLPMPSDSDIQLLKHEGGEMAALQFSGLSKKSKVSRYTKVLLESIQKEGWKAKGPVLLAVYDPPMTLPFLRRNELLVPVNR